MAGGEMGCDQGRPACGDINLERGHLRHDRRIRELWVADYLPVASFFTLKLISLRDG